MEPPPQSFFERRPTYAPSHRTERDERGLSALRESLAGSRARFATVNAVAWSVAVGVPLVVGAISQPSATGELKLGAVLFATQCCLLPATSALLDRGQRQSYRRWNNGRNASSSSAPGEAGHDVPS